MRRAAAIALIGVFGAGAHAARSYEPKVNYQIHCMGCHRADGSGEAGRVPSLRSSLVLLSGLPEGRAFVAEVPGVAQAPLSDEDIASLLNWMARSLSDVPLPVDFRDYSAAEIKASRSHPLAEVSTVRARLMRSVAAQ